MQIQEIGSTLLKAFYTLGLVGYTLGPLAYLGYTVVTVGLNPGGFTLFACGLILLWSVQALFLPKMLGTIWGEL